MFVGSWFGGAALCRRVHRGQIALETAGAAAARANLLLFRAIAMRSEHGKAAVEVDAAEQTLLDGLEDKNPKYLRGDDDRGCPNFGRIEGEAYSQPRCDGEVHGRLGRHVRFEIRPAGFERFERCSSVLAVVSALCFARDEGFPDKEPTMFVPMIEAYRRFRVRRRLG